MDVKANNRHIKLFSLIVCLLTLFVPQMNAQELDDLQNYLDEIATEQYPKSVVKHMRKANSVEIPVGLTVIDLSKFSSNKNRTKVLEVKASVKFINGTISASSSFSGSTCLMNVYGDATVILDSTVSVDAGMANNTNCLAAVGIYGASTIYHCGDIIAPDAGTGTSIWIEGDEDIYNHVSIYVGASFSHDISIHIPTVCYYSGYCIMAPCGGNKFTYADLEYINVNLVEFFRVKLGTDGCIYLIDTRLLGDVNGDGVVNIGDPICLVSWLLGQNPPVFIYEQADVNCDGKLNISDAIGIVQLILKNEAPIHAAPIKGNDCIEVKDATLDGTNIILNNSNKYTAFSMDVTLPEGNRLERVSMNPNRGSNHQLLYNQLSDGKYRIIGMSMNLDAFEGGNGDLLRLETSGDNMGELTIDNICFVDMNAQNVSFDDIHSVPTGIKKDRIINGTQVKTDGKSIVIDSEDDKTIKVYTVAGALYKMLEVKCGHNVIDIETPGVYIINNKKLMIK